MSEVAIRVENLGKRYQLGRNGGQNGARYRTLRETLSDGVRNLFRNAKSAGGNASGEEFWALRDVSFEVKQGDVVGIIGRNGAGKSTLLKILCRITEPTTGRIQITGRVASLLEVGTGFHQELTGRENIFLNGAILGMTRSEMKAKFRAIVEFAEVERFLDTPVKRYSSGMYVRLAFAVAAHLDPEILIVDEVLAVGDAEFQKKCLGKMEDVSRGGRTVLFVSHDLYNVEKLCRSALLLRDGHLADAGPAGAMISKYRAQTSATSLNRVRSGEGGFTIERLSIQGIDSLTDVSLTMFSDFTLMLAGTAQSDVRKVLFEACFDGTQGRRALSLYSSFNRQAFDIPEGPFCVECRVPRLRLFPGEYMLTIHAEAGGTRLDTLADLCRITIVQSESQAFLTAPNQRQGSYVEEFSWRLVSSESD